jgi:4-amino-4-deoxy-L-arabinose transferase-like glycosyltransferase
MAVSMPPLGFILAIVVAMRSTKMNSKHAAWIIVVSIIASLVWILIIISGALSTPSTDF